MVDGKCKDNSKGLGKEHHNNQTWISSKDYIKKMASLLYIKHWVGWSIFKISLSYRCDLNFVESFIA